MRIWEDKCVNLFVIKSDFECFKKMKNSKEKIAGLLLMVRML